MTSTTIDDAPFIEPSTRTRRNYLNDEYGVLSWLLTRDHKRIAILYLFSVTTFFIVGGIFAFLMRLELLTPEGDMFTSDQYNKLFTLHGIVMIFFFLIPAIPAVFGNFVLPIMLGAKDLAFPRLNLLSWYVYMAGSALMLWAVNDRSEGASVFKPSLFDETRQSDAPAPRRDAPAAPRRDAPTGARRA